MLTCILQSNFAADYCLYLHSLGSPTLDAVSKFDQTPKETNHHQQCCNNLPCRNPLFTVHVFSRHTKTPHTAANLNGKENWKKIYCARSRGHSIQVTCYAHVSPGSSPGKRSLVNINQGTVWNSESFWLLWRTKKTFFLTGIGNHLKHFSVQWVFYVQSNMYIRLHVKYFYHCLHLITVFYRKFLKVLNYKIFYINSSSGCRSFTLGRTDEQRDRYLDAKCYISKFCQSANKEQRDIYNLHTGATNILIF